MEEINILEESGIGSDDADSVMAFLIKCYLNIALTTYRMDNFPESIHACNEVLLLDCSNIKALFRRAKAFTTPVSAGTVEQHQALKDLRTALSLDSTNVEIQ